jgi:hypothetical protein
LKAKAVFIILLIFIVFFSFTTLIVTTMSPITSNDNLVGRWGYLLSTDGADTLGYGDEMEGWHPG